MSDKPIEEVARTYRVPMLGGDPYEVHKPNDRFCDLLNDGPLDIQEIALMPDGHYYITIYNDDERESHETKRLILLARREAEAA